MNVVIIGVSTSQALLLMIAALSLVMLGVLLWVNHRTLFVPMARPVVVLQSAGVLCPVNLVSWPTQTILVRDPARAPPTFHSPLIHSRAQGPDPRVVHSSRPAAMVRHVEDAAA